MNRTEKLTLLTEALQGKKALLSQYKRQQQQKAMPYLKAQGIVDFHHCPPALLGLEIIYDYYPTLSKCEQGYASVAECLRLYHQTEPKLQFLFSAGCTILELEEVQYDNQPLAYIMLKCRDYKEYYIKGGTIADLRHWYSLSEDSFHEWPRLTIFFEEQSERLAWYGQNPFIENKP